MTGMFDFSNSLDGDIIHTANDSATLLYRKDASEAWREIQYTLYPGSTWKHGRFLVDNFPSGEYTIAVWDKEALGEEEYFMPERRMQVYPNPAEGRVNVSWGEATDGQIQIISTDGKELRRIEFTQANGIEIATEGLPQGCYTVLRLGKDGNLLNTEKLIIK